jgi:adenylate cyclase
MSAHREKAVKSGLVLKLFGGFDAALDGEPLGCSSKKGCALLAYVALCGKEHVSRTELMTLLWPDRGEQQARASLRKELSHLRKALDCDRAPVLLTETDTVGLDRAQLRVDVLSVQDCAEDQVDEDALLDVASLIRSELLAGFNARSDAFDSWLELERQRLSQHTRRLLAAAVSIHRKRGDIAAALDACEQALRLNPLAEEFYRLQMRLLLDDARFTEALQVYQRCETTLNNELQVSPDERTRALQAEILDRRAQRPTVAAPSARASNAAGATGDGRPAIAVLPFQCLSSGVDDAYLADGITEDIITELARFADLFVVARTSSFRFQGSAEPLPEIAADLGARYLVVGTVRRRAQRIRVNVQLVDASANNTIWAQRYDRQLEDMFEVEDEITSGIVGVLPGRVVNHEGRRVARRMPEDLAAYELLIAGRVHHHRFTKTDNEKAFELIDRAIELAPQYAAAWAWKACLLGQAIGRRFLPDPPALVAEAKTCVNKGLALDENDVECHRILCEMHTESREWASAERHNQRAIALNPNDPRLSAQRGELLTWSGQAAEGEKWLRAAMTLDPYAAPMWGHLLGRALLQQRRFEEAVAAYSTSSYPRPGYFADIAACQLAMGNNSASAEACREVLERMPSFSRRRYLDGLLYQDTAAYEHHARLIDRTPLPQ